MDVLEAIKQRRSYRAFDPRAVEAEKRNAILEAATWAPSPGNRQPWEFIVITGDDSRMRLYELSEMARQHGRIEVHGFTTIRPMPFDSVEEEEEEERKVTESIMGYSFEFLKTVPLIVAVIGNAGIPSPTSGLRRQDDGYKYACAAAIQNMLLTAHSLGLGSLWFTFFEQELVRRFLGVETNRLVIALVCIGYPMELAPSTGRMSLKEKVRYFD